MPVFDFSAAPADKKETKSQCTYITFRSNETKATPEKPMLILDNSKREWKHHSCGYFSNPAKQTAFEFKEEDGVFPADILKIDSRFTSLIKWLGENLSTSVFQDRIQKKDMLFTKSARSLLAEAPSFLLRTDFFSL